MERRLLGGGGVWCEPRLSSKPELSAAMLAHWYGLTGDSRGLGTGFSYRISRLCFFCPPLFGWMLPLISSRHSGNPLLGHSAQTS